MVKVIVQDEKKLIQKERKTNQDYVFYLLVALIAIVGLIAYCHTDSQYRADVITQMTSVSIMFIFPMVAVLVGVIAFLPSQTQKGIKPQIIRFITFDGMAIGLGYILSTSLAYNDTHFQVIAYILQLVIFLWSICLIRAYLKMILAKYNS